MLSFLAKVY